MNDWIVDSIKEEIELEISRMKIIITLKDLQILSKLLPNLKVKDFIEMFKN